MSATPLTIQIGDGRSVSGLWQAPDHAAACLALAHGAGTDMKHKTMVALADGLQVRGVATLRYNFLYSERGAKRPDAPAEAHAVVRAAVAAAAKLSPKLPLFAGGRSFGGRMTSQAQALEPLPGVRGLVFFAFPLHPAGRPGDERAKHLADVALPMLFLQGTNDALAQLDLLQAAVVTLRPRAELKLFRDADHSFHVPAKTGRSDAEVLTQSLDAARDWMLARV
jgi:uncharacterized protein